MLITSAANALFKIAKNADAFFVFPVVELKKLAIGVPFPMRFQSGTMINNGFCLIKDTVPVFVRVYALCLEVEP